MGEPSIDAGERPRSRELSLDERDGVIGTARVDHYDVELDITSVLEHGAKTRPEPVSAIRGHDDHREPLRS
jgi:hypothetical protein